MRHPKFHIPRFDPPQLSASTNCTNLPALLWEVFSSVIIFRSAMQTCLTEAGRGLSPVVANRGWKEKGKVGEKEPSSKQQRLLSCICQNLVSYSGWQLEMLVVLLAIPPPGCWVISDGRHFFLPSPHLCSFFLSVAHCFCHSPSLKDSHSGVTLRNVNEWLG